MAEKKLLEQLADKIRMKNYSKKTADTYVMWSRRYILFHGKRHPREMGKVEIRCISFLPGKQVQCERCNTKSMLPRFELYVP